jgi:hypothetical protein
MTEIFCKGIERFTFLTVNLCHVLKFINFNFILYVLII